MDGNGNREFWIMAASSAPTASVFEHLALMMLFSIMKKSGALPSWEDDCSVDTPALTPPIELMGILLIGVISMALYITKCVP